MANAFITLLEKIGQDFEKGLTDAVKYLPAAATLASIIFPAAAAPLAEAVSVTDLIQNGVATVEQKYAASGVQSGTGAQKSAEVLTLTHSAVTTLLATPAVASELKAAGITVNSDYIGNLISAIVGILNVQGVTGTASVALAAAA